jgi:hypothetical protein
MNSECSICYDKLTCSRFTLSCNHDFCGECILQWYAINPNCPMCRCEINENEIQENIYLELFINKIKNHNNNKAEELLKSFFNSIIFKWKSIVSYFEIYYLNIKILTELKIKCMCMKKIPWDENIYMYKKTFSQSY